VILESGYANPLGYAKVLQGVHVLFNCLHNEILTRKDKNYRAFLIIVLTITVKGALEKQNTARSVHY